MACYIILGFRKNKALLVGGASFVFGLSIALCILYSNLLDINILNGEVLSKMMVRVPCQHSYLCHCNKKTCQTCYEHVYDQDWNVITSVGTLTIDSVDEQGLLEPPRWSIIKIHDPVSATQIVTNYVLGSPTSIFNLKRLEDDNKLYGNYLPNYPRVYDYYRLNHAINMGVHGFKEFDEYNNRIADALRVIGPKKQANIILVFVPLSDPEYASALERHWLGGKKNDIIIVVGVQQYPKISFANSFTFAKSFNNELLVEKLHEDIEGIGDISKIDNVMSVVNNDVEMYFNRQQMSKFEYLKNDLTLTGTQITIGVVIYAIMMALLILLLVKFS